jgi:hypothetical protein
MPLKADRDRCACRNDVQRAHLSTLNEDRSGCLDYLVAPIIGNVTLRGIRQNRHHLGSPISPEFTQ